MSTAAFTVLVAFPIAMILLAIANAVETSGQLIESAQAMLDDEPWPPPWLTHIDLRDDGAAAKRSPATEAAARHAIALANDEPDPDFIARTRRLVVDELAQRRGAVPS